MPQETLILNGRVDVPQGAIPTVHLEFNASTLAIEQACCLLGLFCVRLMSNLAGRSEAATIANSLTQPVPKYESSTLGSVERRGSGASGSRSFVFQCLLQPMRQPQFTFKAKGFGFLAKGVGEAAIDACDALRQRILRSFNNDRRANTFLNQFCRCIGEDYLQSNISMGNHTAVVANAIIQAASVAQAQEAGGQSPSRQSAVHGEGQEAQYQVADGVMQRFDAHRQQFFESVNLPSPSRHQVTALCALQIHVMMSVMGHWQYMLEAIEDCKEVCHHITHHESSSPESCVALCQAMGEQEYDLVQAEQFIGNEFFVGKGVDPENQRALSAALLRFRYETLLATAEVARDDRVAEMIRTEKQRADEFLSEHGF